MKKIYFAVTNDLLYDQRMSRICGSLAAAGYSVMLVGRKGRHTPATKPRPYGQHRLPCWFLRGKLFYIEFQLRLFGYLLFQKMDAICAIDLDTIIPCLVISKLKKVVRIYDAHELFCEMKEVVSRPLIYRCWKAIEKRTVPRFIHGYTVSPLIVAEFKILYGVDYALIRNAPILADQASDEQKGEPYLLYQGAVNEGRSFETLIPAMREVDLPLVICGDGNFMYEARRLVTAHQLGHKIIFKGPVPPSELPAFTRGASIGLTLFEKTGKSNYYSLANRFFDYMHAAVPQLCMDYPAYREINQRYRIAILIEDLSPSSIAREINNMLNSAVLYDELQRNCTLARKEYNWQEEEKNLIQFYQKLWD